MAKQRIRDEDGSSGGANEGAEGGRYALSDEELYERAVGILDKCKIENRD